MAGETALISGSGQAMPGTSYAAFDFGSITSDPDNIVTEVSAGVFRPDQAGYYLIIAEAEFEATHNKRSNCEYKGRKNSTDVVGWHGSSYGRNNSNDFQHARVPTVLPFNGTSDTFDFQAIRDAGAGTPAGTHNNTYVKLVRLTDTTTGIPYLHVGTPTAGAYGGEGYSVTTGWDVITETDDTVLSLENGQDIRLKETGRPYLIVYGAKNSDNGGARTTRVSKLFYNDDPMHHSAGYAYQRNSADQHAVPNGIGLVRPSVADLDVDLRIAGYVDNHAVLWGTFDNGTWTLSATEAGMFAIALPVGTNIGVYEDETGNQTINGSGTVDINTFRTTVEEDSPFSRVSNTAVDITSATDVFILASLLVERTASSGTRGNYSTRLEIEGVDQAQSDATDFQRGEQGGDDTKNAVITSTFVGAVSADDTVNFEKYIKTSQNSGGNDVSDAAGAIFIDLGSLVAATGHTETITDNVGVTDAAARVVDAIRALTEPVGVADTVVEDPPAGGGPLVFEYPGDLAPADIWWAIDAAQVTGHTDGAKTVAAVEDQTGNEPDSTADNGEEAVYRASTHFRRPSIEGDGAAHLDFDWTSSYTVPGFTITAHKWLTGTGIRNVLHSAKKGDGPPNKHVQGTQSGLSNEGGPFHVVMDGDGSGPAHLDPSTDPGSDGGDIDTVFIDEECVTIQTVATNGDVELWKYTSAKGWEQLIDGNSGDNDFNGFSIFSREDGNTSSMAYLAISYMLAGELTNYTLDDLKLAAEDIAEWCHIKPVLHSFEVEGVSAVLEIDYTDTNPYNQDGNGPLESDVILTVTGGTIHLEIDDAVGGSWINSDYAAGQHTLTLPVSNLDNWNDMTEIRMRLA